MQINKLTLEQFRSAKTLQLDLHENLNIFIGVNGAGKTSILDAAAILLSWLVNRIKHANTSGRPITEPDIRNGESTANLEISCKYQDIPFWWNLAKTRKGHSKEIISILLAPTEIAKRIRSEISDSDEQTNLPLFVYYPVNRSVVDIPLRIRSRHSFELLTAYDDSLTGGANFRTFFEWFREREDLENGNVQRTVSAVVIPKLKLSEV